LSRSNLLRVAFRLPRTPASWTIGAISLLILLTVAGLLLVPRNTSWNSLDVSSLPLLNATLNGASGFLLATGYLFIRRRRVKPHRFCMLSAFGLSALFLMSYVTYHAVAGSTRFSGQGLIRPIYFTILISHIILAALVLPLALTTLYRALQGTFAWHRQIARWTLPIWLYVSISGVIVYVLLYHLPT
jgi:putative membrane protein